MVDRKYAMTRLGKGDYLLPSNDGGTLYRIRRYDEDGSAVNGDGTPLKGSFWGVQRYTGRVGSIHRDDVENSDLWEWFDLELPTRDAAIRSALEASERMAEAAAR